MERSTGASSALWLIAGHNLIQNTVLNERGYVAGNLVVTGTMVGLGRASGLSLVDMGISRRASYKDLRLVGLAAAVTAGATLVALSHPRLRDLLGDERARDTSADVIAQKTLVRFPIGTALFEELTFRGVLPALVSESNWVGDMISAGVFGLWHVIPTARVLPGNPVSSNLTAGQRAFAVLAGSASTALAGLALSILRRRSGNILVPWLAHTAFNTLTYLAGVLAWRIERGRS